ncbi:hypothetical protein, partial [Clavibacter michiganensis]|uniref:hypothetical protein n=1 Tax=Clavibacter michiganensis TaxID=28447 RepID=UPI00292CD6D4
CGLLKLVACSTDGEGGRCRPRGVHRPLDAGAGVVAAAALPVRTVPSGAYSTMSSVDPWFS